MKKGTITRDITERLFELGRITARDTARAVNETLNPIKWPEQGKADTATIEQATEKLQKEVPNSSRLDVDRLRERYEKSSGQEDKAKIEAMRQKLFRMVKEGEITAVNERMQEDRKKIQQETQEQEEKKKRESQQAPAPIPQGKKRRSIFQAARKKTIEMQPDRRPNSSKG